MINTPIVSFISINYNGYNDSCELINSIIQHIKSIAFEIIIVDNNSEKNEAALLKANYPNITAIRSSTNLGFAGGNNLGIKAAKGKYIFFINNDTYVTNDGISYLIKRIESSPNIAGVSPKIRFAFAPQNIQFAGYTPLSNITLRNRLIGFDQPDSIEYSHANPTPYLHGAAMMLKRSAIDKVGLMPDIFFLYYEELDWSNQFTRANYELWYEPKCTVFHKESQSTGKESRLKAFYITRNRLLFAWRNLKGINRWLSLAYQIIVVSTKNNLNFILNKRFYLVHSTVSGIFSFIIMQNKTK